MKLLLENWRKFLHEATSPIVTFDFDDTLALSHWGKEEDDWVHDGPHQEMVDRLMNYHEKKYNIYIVTSRHEEIQDENGKWHTFDSKRKPPKKYIEEYQMPIWEFVKKNNLPIKDVYFTNGKPKIDTLLKLKSEIHHDDDLDDIEDAEKNDIKGIISKPKSYEIN